ncbi:MAG: hypothetical protein RLZZ77_978 [Bacteroidota bacterium]
MQKQPNDSCTVQIIRPHKTLLVILSVGVLCGALMWVMPSEGIPLFGSKLTFKTWKSFTDTTNTNKIEDVGAYLSQLDSLASDSLMSDSAKVLNVDRMNSITSIQFKDHNSSSLFPFFEALEKAKSEGFNFHILHYGDSQIESDRMTSLLRQKWQEEFGGSGPGLVAPVPITASANISQSQSGNWKRYTAYGFDDGKVTHSHYGALCSFGRFSPPLPKEQINTADTLEAWIEFRPSGMAQGNCKRYTKATMYFGYHQYPVTIQLMLNDSVIESKTFEASNTLLSHTWNLGYTPSKLKFVFKGVDSPEVQNILLQGASGVMVDNIALRGSSGTVFKKLASSDLSKTYADMNPQLVILQFGGNSVPYVTDAKAAKAYGNYFQAQIQYLKKLLPNASFLVIGPSDMSTSIDGVYQSWAGVSLVRDAMKEAAFAENCGFWDMYEVMGGKNSMVSWVTNNPPYAGPDYTHFTPLGARKMAELLYKAIHKEYTIWKGSL